MSVKRYNLAHLTMKERDEGEYVLYEDYAALEAELHKFVDLYHEASNTVGKLESSNTRLQADNIRLTLRVENLEAECARLRQELEDIKERAQDEAWDRDTKS